MERRLFANHLHNLQAKTRMFGIKKLQKTAFSLVKSRLALGSPGCLGVFSSSPCRKGPNTQENGCWLPPSDHIQSETLLQNRQDQEKKGMDGPASLLHLVDSGSCYFTLCLGSPLRKYNNIFWPNSPTKTKCYFIWYFVTPLHCLQYLGCFVFFFKAKHWVVPMRTSKEAMGMLGAE